MTNATVCKLESPAVALKNLRERLLIAFAYSDDSFVLVSDYPVKSPGSDRELIAFVFHRVERFAREAGNLERLRRFERRYAANEAAGSHVVQSVSTRHDGVGREHVELWFGPNLGGVDLDYAEVEAFTRGSKVQEKGGDYKYYDLQSGVPFDFFKPFPDLLPS